MKRGVGPWLIAAGVSAAAAFALWMAPSAPPAVGRGSVAPAFELSSLDGDRVALEGFAGRVVLVNFWATWCKPCEAEMPAMERLYRRLRNDGFDLLAVSVDTDVSDVARFRDRLGLSFPILLDPTQATARRYQTFKFPESLLIGPDGLVIERYIGSKDWDAPAYVNRIRRLLGRTLPSPSA